MKFFLLILALFCLVTGVLPAQSPDSLDSAARAYPPAEGDTTEVEERTNIQSVSDTAFSRSRQPNYDNRELFIPQTTQDRSSSNSFGEHNEAVNQMISTDYWYYIYRRLQYGNELHYIGSTRPGRKEVPELRAYYQNGRENRAVILQTRLDSEIHFSQYGSDNRIMIMQADTLSTGNNSANVQQRGTNNRAAISQD